MHERENNPKIFVFTGPHGAGRKTVAEMASSTLGIKHVISYTTRPQKPTETEGEDYHFISPSQFAQAERNDEFLEISDIDGHRYGVKQADIAKLRDKHDSLYLVLNRYGAETLKKIYGDDLIRIFIYAERDILQKRIRESGDSEEDMKRNMSHYDEEMAYKDNCEHIFENIDLAHTVFDLTKALDDYLERNLLDLD
jgi:guanylate kinase